MKNITLPALCAVLLAVGGCSKADIVPVSAREFRVVVDATNKCGPTGAQRYAVDSAAVATVRRGFDRFRVLALRERSAPVYISAYGGIAQRHYVGARFLLYREGEAGAAEAIDARRHLGENWKDRVRDGVSC